MFFHTPIALPARTSELLLSSHSAAVIVSSGRCVRPSLKLWDTILLARGTHLEGGREEVSDVLLDSKGVFKKYY